MKMANPQPTRDSRLDDDDIRGQKGVEGMEKRADKRAAQALELPALPDGAKTIHLIFYTHWDREWHLTAEQYRVQLVEVMDGLLDILRAESNITFMFDGQAIVLEDYWSMRSAPSIASCLAWRASMPPPHSPMPADIIVFGWPAG
jgi:hypothetical protein